MFCWYLLLVAVSSSWVFVNADRLEFHSFEAPFTEVDAAGVRQVSKHWRTGGVTTVNQNFVRLTPDRQSKKGALWSKKALGVPSLSAIIKFRISGQGKSFFGDGIAVWLVQQGYYAEGDVHGSIEKFTGVGIILDTFKNTENAAQHKDITVITNDGTRTLDEMLSDAQGCDANFRYHAERADFSVTDASRVKLLVEDLTMTVFIDAKNSGTWVECVKVHLPLAEGWATRAHLAVTASTGQLADNHDVLSILTYSDVAVMEQEEEKSLIARKFALDPSLTLEQNIGALGEAVNGLLSSLDVLQHQMEHQLASVNDHIKNMLGKIEQRETTSEGRIEHLEEMVATSVQSQIEGRLRTLEVQIKGQMNKKVSSVEASLAESVGKLQQTTAQSAGGWKLPFFLLLLVLCAAGVGMLLFYRKMMKMHLL